MSNEGTLAPLVMVVVSLVFLYALDKSDTMIKKCQHAYANDKIVMYLIVILILQIIIVLLLVALHLV
ncbi:MAG: hypothetical protein PHX65_04825 [Sulfurimonas sp.]|nr:hypothetical protein [Sulfurimonas sp.]